MINESAIDDYQYVFEVWGKPIIYWFFEILRRPLSETAQSSSDEFNDKRLWLFR